MQYAWGYFDLEFYFCRYARFVQIHFVPSLCRNISIVNDFKSLLCLRNIIKNISPDVVHTHSSKTGVLGRIAAKWAGVSKVIHTVHGYSFPAATNVFVKWLFIILEYIAKYFTDNLIVLNDSDKNISIKTLGYSPKKISFLPNGVSLPDINTSLNSRNTERFSVSMVARLWPQKDPFTFVYAAVILAKKFPNSFFTLVGDGELKEELEEFVLKKGCSKQIIFTGWISDPSTILSKSHVFVLSSKWEGMPLAILEAMSYSLPCIVTNIPGNRDLVTHDYNGKLFEIGDTDTLVQYLSEYYHDESLTICHGCKSRLKVENEYQLNSRCKALFYDIYLS